MDMLSLAESHSKLSSLPVFAEQAVTARIIGPVSIPIRFKSGILAPMYQNWRRLGEYPTLRDWILDNLAVQLQRLIPLWFNLHPRDIVIAGVAVGALPISGALAHMLRARHCYVRRDKKKHGMALKIDGADVKGRQVVYIEDTVTHATSSGSDIELVRSEGGIVKKLISISSYDFPEAVERFSKLGVDHETLLPFRELRKVMGEVTKASGLPYFTPIELKTIDVWHQNPGVWTKRMEQRFPELRQIV